MHLVLHLGPQKTGSTYLQHLLWENREVLAQAGWTYPERGRARGEAGHHLLARRPRGQPDDAVMSEMREDVRGADQVVISSERFAFWSAEQLTTLADRLGADEVTIVYCLRDPFDRFESCWKGLILQGASIGLPEMFAEHFDDPHRSTLLNPLKTLRRYVETDSRFRTRILCYEPQETAGGDLAALLWHGILGLDAAYRVTLKRPNRSLSTEASELLRALLWTLRRRLPELDTRALLAAMATANLPIHRFGLSETDREIEALARTKLRPNMREQILSRDCHFYSDIRRVLKQEFQEAVLGVSDAHQFFADRRKALNYFDVWDLLSEPTIHERIDTLAARIEIAAQDANNGEHALG